MHALRKNNIDAFLMGCMTATFNKRKKMPTQTKVFFADVPYGVLKYMPTEIKNDIVCIDHEFETNRVPGGVSIRDYAESVLERYRNEARLVVTSRFHGAMISLAMGIPVILVNEAFTLRFSYLCSILPFYTRETFSNINWNPEAVDIEMMKAKMMGIAKKQVDEAIKKYKDICDHSSLLEYREWNNAGQITYYDEALEFINKKWNYNDCINYSIWGFNDNAMAIINYFIENYPNAQLIEIYDAHKDLVYDGISSRKPTEIEAENGHFIFVTTFVAEHSAKKLFMEKGITPERYFICMRKYVTERDIKEPLISGGV
jgi:hypothetical protein